MTRDVARIAVPFLIAALASAAGAQQHEYTLEFSGAIEGGYAGSADIDHVEYTTFGADATNSVGPYKITLQVRDAEVLGTEGAASVTLTFNGPVPPGEFPVLAESEDAEAVTGVVYAHSDERRLAFERARFGITDEPGTLTLSRFDREAASGTFSFTASNRADPVETVQVSGSFTGLEYRYAPELEVTGTGPFAAMPTKFTRAEAGYDGERMVITLELQWGSALVFSLTSGQTGRTPLGPDEPGSVTLEGEPGTGFITLTRSGEDTLSADFDVEVPFQGATGTLQGRFDYVPLAEDG